jgi:hypothetical protein
MLIWRRNYATTKTTAPAAIAKRVNPFRRLGGWSIAAMTAIGALFKIVDESDWAFLLKEAGQLIGVDLLESFTPVHAAIKHAGELTGAWIYVHREAVTLIVVICFCISPIAFWAWLVWPTHRRVVHRTLRPQQYVRSTMVGLLCWCAFVVSDRRR